MALRWHKTVCSLFPESLFKLPVSDILVTWFEFAQRGRARSRTCPLPRFTAGWNAPLPFGKYLLLCLIVLLMTGVTNLHATTRALLIGVSGYPKLDQAKRLLGPANDVQLMRAALLNSGLQAPNITVLADGVANSSALPTRNQILGQLRALADRSQPEDWAIVFFSGHGSQQPQLQSEIVRPGAYIEPDGLDEIFLPYDVGHWNATLARVDGALLDDEIGVALEYFHKRHVKVWAIFDTCHAGDMAKSVSAAPVDAKPRFIDPAELGVPGVLLEQARLAARQQSASSTGKTWSGFTRQASRSIVVGAAFDRRFIFYASQPDEPAAEEPLVVPANFGQAGAGEWRYFGLFTYLIAKELPKWQGDFADLAHRVRGAYSARPFPTPSFEGNLSIVPNFFQPALTFGAKASP